MTSVWDRTVKQVPSGSPMEGTRFAILLKFQTRRKWRVKRQAVSVSAATFQLARARLSTRILHPLDGVCGPDFKVERAALGLPGCPWCIDSLTGPTHCYQSISRVTGGKRLQENNTRYTRQTCTRTLSLSLSRTCQSDCPVPARPDLQLDLMNLRACSTVRNANPGCSSFPWFDVEVAGWLV